MASSDFKSINNAHLVRRRRLYHNRAVRSSIEQMGEDKIGRHKHEEVHWSPISSIKPTFIMLFSPNGQRVASTHGDHRIYICDLNNGRLLHTLEGHSKTPWCLAWHPTNCDILASGCLAGEVRVWDLKSKACESWSSENNAIITSVGFHPKERVLVIATGNFIHFWDWSESEPFAKTTTPHVREKVKFVEFDSSGKKLITGISNLPKPPSYGNDSLKNRIIDSYLTTQGALDNLSSSASTTTTSATAAVAPAATAKASSPNSTNCMTTTTTSTMTTTKNMTQSSENSTHNINHNKSTIIINNTNKNGNSNNNKNNNDDPSNSQDSASSYPDNPLNRNIGYNDITMNENLDDALGSRLMSSSSLTSSATIISTAQTQRDVAVEVITKRRRVESVGSIPMNLPGSSHSPLDSSQHHQYQHHQQQQQQQHHHHIMTGPNPINANYSPLEVASAAAIAAAANSAAVAAAAASNLVMGDGSGASINTWQRPHLHVWVSQYSNRGTTQNVWWMTPFPVSNSNFRIQCWDFSLSSIPSIIDSQDNIVTQRCRIDSDASIDMTRDGSKIACLVPKDDACLPSFDLRVFSLKSNDFGVCYFHLPHGPNAISVSLSPSANYAIVGLASSRFMGNYTEDDLTIAKVFKLDEGHSFEHIRDIKTKLDGSLLSLNAIRWLSRGIVYSVGPLHHQRYQARMQRYNFS